MHPLRARMQSSHVSRLFYHTHDPCKYGVQAAQGLEACRYLAFVCSAAVLPQALRRRRHRKSSCRSSLRSAVACALGKPYQDLFLSSRLTHALIGQRPPGSDMSIARSVSEDCLCLCMSWVLMMSEGWPRSPARRARQLQVQSGVLHKSQCQILGLRSSPL